MKTAKMAVILTMALFVLLSWAANAEPMGAAFTYQGHLYDNNDVANGLYDFQFRLYDEPNIVIGQQKGGDINVSDTDVIDGYFIVELDFGSSVFDGNAVWLDIGVRPGDQNDPCQYSVLEPRQKIMSVPFSFQTRGIFVDPNGNVGIGTTTPASRLEIIGMADPCWIGWEDPAYSFGFDVNTELVPALFTGLIDTDTGIIINHNGEKKGRWGFHLIDAFGLDPGKRVTLLAGKHTNRAALYYYQSSDKTYHTLQLGSDLDSQGIFIDGDGKVGVGDTDPNANLEVVNDFMVSSVASEAGDLFMVLSSGYVGIGRHPATNRLEVEGDASKTTAGSWLANSDERIKTDIQTVTGALETLDKVRLVSFTYTEDYRNQHVSVEDRRYLNVIAQEFRDVFPDYVRSSGEKLPNGDEILQVDSYPLTVYSAAAVQELYEIVKSKDAEIKVLHEENIEIKKRLAQMQQMLSQLTLAQKGGLK